MKQTDYIVIGNGIAGLRVCREFANEGRVVVLTKDHVTESNTKYAQGGVAAVVSDGHPISLHYEDTIKAGERLSALIFLSARMSDGWVIGRSGRVKSRG